MGWRQNMGMGIQNTILIPKSNKSNIRNIQENELIKTNIADIADIALRVQNIKTPEIIIKKMDNCLHGKPCHKEIKQQAVKGGRPLTKYDVNPEIAKEW